MGYSVRSSDWRLSIWAIWDSASDCPAWDNPANFIELYDHRDDTAPLDLDGTENVNVAAEPENAAVVQNLTAVAHEWFGCHDGAATGQQSGLKTDDPSLKLLFMDESFIATRSGVRFTMHQPRVAEAPAIAPTEPWENNSVADQTITVVDWSPSEKRLYYGCRHGLGDKEVGGNRECLATSSDGGHTWRKPSLGLVEIAGSVDNNVLPPASNTSQFIDMFRDTRPGVPDSEIWKALVNTDGAQYIWGSSKDDGIHWKQLATTPALTDADTQNILVGWHDGLQKYVTYIRHNLANSIRSHREIGLCLSSDLKKSLGANTYQNKTPSCAANMSASDACCVTVFKASPPDPVDNVDIYTNACINYSGTLLCFPSFYFQFPTNAVWKAGNDGLLDLRLLHGGRWSDGELALRSLNYTAAWNARSPYVPLGINRCAFEGSVFQTGGWCSATDGSLASTSVATSRLYMGHGYLVSANGEEIYQYAAANPVSEAAYDIKGSQNATYHSWGNNSAVVRLVSRRDGECSCPFRLYPERLRKTPLRRLRQSRR